MQYRNTKTGYGLVARTLHWVMAVAIIGLFALGYWMRTLSYYNPYYKSAVDLHQSVGILVFATLVFRFVWKVANPSPENRRFSVMEHAASSAMHWTFYIVLLCIIMSGYLISTLDGRPILFFDLLDIPSLYTQKGWEGTAGQVHWIVAYVTMFLVLVHSIAALWHHYVSGDEILVRMIKSPKDID